LQAGLKQNWDRIDAQFEEKQRLEGEFMQKVETVIQDCLDNQKHQEKSLAEV
jgi:hypothetical protein